MDLPQCPLQIRLEEGRGRREEGREGGRERRKEGGREAEGKHIEEERGR